MTNTKEYENKDHVLKELSKKMNKLWIEKHKLRDQLEKVEDEYDNIYRKYYERLDKIREQ